jgi:putative PIN family toxin of toxin-antitoxin system
MPLRETYPLVIDTNIALDVLVFNDPAAAALRAALQSKSLQWIATEAMRAELERVLAYPKIAPRLVFYGLTAAGVLAAFDQLAVRAPSAAKAKLTCTDADDQPFIDLAVAHQAQLLSKDKAILCMRKRLLAHGVRAGPAIE